MRNRIAVLGEFQPTEREPIPLGIQGLDEQTGGGVDPGSSMLIFGPNGDGTKLATEIAVRSGFERVLWFGNAPVVRVDATLERLSGCFSESKEVYLCSWDRLEQLRSQIEAYLPSLVVIQDIQDLSLADADAQDWKSMILYKKVAWATKVVREVSPPCAVVITVKDDDRRSPMIRLEVDVVVEKDSDPHGWRLSKNRFGHSEVRPFTLP